MPRNTSVTLSEHFTDFIATQVETGRYGSASEVVRAGLRLLEDHEAKVRALEQALVEGEESGFSETFDFDGFLQRMRREHEGR